MKHNETNQISKKYNKKCKNINTTNINSHQRFSKIGSSEILLKSEKNNNFIQTGLCDRRFKEILLF